MEDHKLVLVLNSNGESMDLLFGSQLRTADYNGNIGFFCLIPKGPRPINDA